MKKVFVAIFAILLLMTKVNAACVKSLNVTGINYRTNGHQHQCLPYIGGYTTEGTGSVSSSCFSISSSPIVIVRLSGTEFCFSPQAHGNANITVSVSADCTCSGEPMSKTLSFRLSEWGLQSLSITGYDISPEFYNQTLKYTATVPYEVTSIEINATALDYNSKITITGNDNLQVGENEVVVNVVTPEDASTDYIITVTRSASDNESGNSTQPSSSSMSSSNSSSDGTSTPSNVTSIPSNNNSNPETGLSYMYFVFGLGIASAFYIIWYIKKMNLNN